VTTTEKPARKAKVGDVVKTGDRYALVVGIEKGVVHVHEGREENTTEDHPLVVDLPVARRLETEHTVVE
jgi:hypothetical protein